jgi:hypothetical protein
MRNMLMLNRLCLGAALWVLAVGVAGAQTVSQGAPVATPTGSTTSSSLADIASRVLTPYDFGGIGDAQRQSCNISTSGNALTINSGSCAYTQADVGKYIVVFGAGATMATAPLASASVNAAGGAYTAVPTITVSDSTGGGALLTANMALATAAVVGAGTGCTAGTQTFTVVGGTNTTPAQFTGVVSGTTLSGALTVTVPGNYQALPSTTAATLTGGGCATSPTISNTWSTLTPTLVFTGYNYTAPTAAYSAGNATLQNPALATAGVLPYASTITAVADTAHITLGGGGFGQTLASSPQYVSWGHDDSAAINALISAVAHTTANASVFLPPSSGGFWGAASNINIAPNALPVTLRGAGMRPAQQATGGTSILALAPMAQLVFQNVGAGYGGGAQDIAFDGNKVATNVAFLNCSGAAFYKNVDFANPAPYGKILILGTPGGSPCVGTSTYATWAEINSAFYNGDVDQPLVGFEVNQTDSHHFGLTVVGAIASDVHINTGANNTSMAEPHVYTAANLVASTYGYLVDAMARLDYPREDGAQLVSIQVNANHVYISGGETQAPSPQAVGVNVASGVSDVVVTAFDATKFATPSTQGVIFNSPVGSGVFGYGNMGASNYNSLPFTGSGVNNLIIGNGAAPSAVGGNGLFIGGFTAVKIAGGASDVILGYGNMQSGASNITSGGWTGVGANSFSKVQGATVASAWLGTSVAPSLTTGAQDLFLGNNIIPTGTTSSRDIVLGTSSSCDTNANDVFLVCASTGSTPLLSGSLVAGALTFTLNGSLTAPSLATAGTIAGSLCATSGGLIMYEVGATGCVISLKSLKRDIAPLGGDMALRDIMGLHPVAFNMREGDERRQAGFLAEDVFDLNPDLSTFDGDGTLQGYKPNAIIADLVAVVQSQQRQINDLRRDMSR